MVKRDKFFIYISKIGGIGVGGRLHTHSNTQQDRETIQYIRILQSHVVPRWLSFCFYHRSNAQTRLDHIDALVEKKDFIVLFRRTCVLSWWEGFVGPWEATRNERELAMALVPFECVQGQPTNSNIKSVVSYHNFIIFWGSHSTSKYESLNRLRMDV